MAPCLCRVTALVVLLCIVSTQGHKAHAKDKDVSDQPALSLSGYDALEAQESTVLAGLGAAGQPRLMEQLNLNPGIPSPSQTAGPSYTMSQPEYMSEAGPGPSVLAQTGSHITELGDTMTAGAVIPTAGNSRFSELTAGSEDNQDTMQANLETALEEIKHDIVVKSKQVMEEKAWVEQVREIMQQYELKVQRVETNIDTLRNDVKTLYKKKRQIENLMLQEKLDSKLNDAKADLRTLDNALLHVKSKERSFEKNKEDVASTVSVIKTQLNKLRGLAPDAVDPDEEELAAPE